MIKNPIDNLIIEGPDLSGKTTLYQSIHKQTGYRWNIQDRSALSMLVHAKLYNRDTFHHIESLKRELNNLNNFMIILMPDWSVLTKRFAKRGDDIQNLTSLKLIYDLFSEAVDEFSDYPNVIIVKSEVTNQIMKKIVSQLLKFESDEFTVFQKMCVRRCGLKSEVVGPRFTFYDHGNFEDVNYDDILYEKEIDYYRSIKKSVMKKIDDEFAGKNEYNRKETVDSRRFIYSSDTCISLIHFLVRGGFLDIKVFIRSSNCKDTLHYDLNFVKYLGMSVYRHLGLKNHKCRFTVSINSCHIPDILT